VLVIAKKTGAASPVEGGIRREPYLPAARLIGGSEPGFQDFFDASHLEILLTLPQRENSLARTFQRYDRAARRDMIFEARRLPTPLALSLVRERESEKPCARRLSVEALFRGQKR